MDALTRKCDNAVAALQDIMINAIPLHVPVLVECSRGPNWSATH